MSYEREQFLTPRGVSLARGARVFEQLPAVAVGSEWQWQVPSGYFWRIVTSYVELTTSATVASRFPHVQFLDQDQRAFCKLASDHSVGAGLTVPISSIVNFGVAGLPEVGAITNSLPDFLLPAGYFVRSFTPGLQAGDQYSAPRLYIEQFEDRRELSDQGGEHIDLAIQLLEGTH